MKKSLISGLSIATLMLMMPAVNQAADIDDKIQEKDLKIEEIAKNKATADAYLSELANEVAVLEKEYNTTLAEKVKGEKELSDIQTKIVVLKKQIAKRTEQLETQARNAQVNSNTSAWLDIITNSESISDAVSKTLAMNTLVNQSNEVMDEQKADEKELASLESDIAKKVKKVTLKTEKLADNKEALTAAKYEQNIKVNAISAELATEKAEKTKFVNQKVKAEKEHKVEMKRIAAEQKRQAAAAAKLAAEQEKAQAQAIKAEETRQDAVANQALVETTEKVADTPATSETETVEKEESAPQKQSSGWANPLSGGYTITSTFGYREDPNGVSGNGHDGIDMAGSYGQQIMASRGGTVVAAEFHYSAGNHVIIDHGDGYYSYYMHMSSITASVGQSVSQGEVLGLMGSTGNSTGTHLHFGISTALWSGFLNPTGFVSL